MHTLFKPFLAAGLSLALAFTAAQAQELRIGAVNVDRLLRDSEPAKAATAKLQQEFAKRDKDIKAAGAEFQAAVQKFERDAPTLSESQRVATQRQLAEQERDLQRRQRTLQEDLGLRRNEETQMLIERINRSIQQVAAAEKYDLIVQEAAYINPRLDITEAVMKRMANAK
jgi:outer membrane protein